ncbi:MAG: 50S ribosomal protein L24 [Nanoarchaeota archaeon]
MKQKFSTSWEASKQPRKKRKYLANAPLHIKQKLMSSHLDKDLKKKYNKRSMTIRKGDEVKVMRGNFSNKKGKIEKVDLKRTRVTIEGIQRSKKDGSKVNVWFNPSKLKIVALNLDDKKRIKSNNIEEKNAPKNK